MSLTIFVVIALTVTVAGFAQATAGIGFALIVAPVLGFLQPELMPVSLLALMLPLNFYVAWSEREAIDRPGAAWSTLGRAVGTLGGLWVLAAVSSGTLNLLIGGSTLLAALASLFAPAFTPGRAAFIAAGLVTGITETATGIGGPPLALIYQHHRPQVLRATIALCFLLGEIISLIVLAITGRIALGQITSALLFLPALALGIGLSWPARSRIDAKLLRALVLGFALISGLLLVLRG